MSLKDKDYHVLLFWAALALGLGLWGELRTTPRYAPGTVYQVTRKRNFVTISKETKSAAQMNREDSRTDRILLIVGIGLSGWAVVETIRRRRG